MAADDVGMARAMFTAMLVIDGTFLGPAAFCALFTGVVLADAGRPMAEIRSVLGATPYLAMISPALAVFVVVLSIIKPCPGPDRRARPGRTGLATR
ncbi:hypothetical protein ACFVH6_33330 [Spirillospora sp. NPDC127200]